MTIQLGSDGEAREERIFVAPFWFDVAIGYWTGEPDLEALRRAARALLSAFPASWRPRGTAPGAVALPRRCPLRGQSAAGTPRSRQSAPPPPPRPGCGAETLDVEGALQELFDRSEDASVVGEIGIVLRRCPRQHLHVLATAPHPMEEVDALLRRAGLARTENCDAG